MKNVFKILGLVLIIAGSALAYFTAVPIAEYAGIAVAALGLALAIVGVLNKTEKKTWKEYVAVICFAAGGLLCGFAGFTDAVLTQVITAVFGVVALIAGLIVSLIKTKN